MKTILEVINLGEEYLKKRGFDRPRREAEELVADVLGVTRISLYLDFERPLLEIELEKCRQFFKRRAQYEPLQYISGSLPFASVNIKVNPHVLIPRPETELLATNIIKDLSCENLEGQILWDMCTGSGCLGISIKKKYPQLRVILSDISEKALEVASENAQLNNVDVEIIQSNLFEKVNFAFDYFVSNPPYVSESEYAQLSPEIQKFEPKQAFLAGASGLIFYEEIAKKLPLFLKKRAWLEIGAHQGESVKLLFSSFGDCLIEKDWSGKDRFLNFKKII